MSTRNAQRPAAPARGARQRLSASRQRQRLIDACISALHLYGPSRTTVEKVVAIARLSPGIVRFYFKSKGAMLVASLRFLSMEFEEQVLEPVGRLRDSPVQALQKLVELYLDPAIASTRKVSVWYAFWGEATARREYQEICGQKDERFAILVHELIGRLIGESGQRHLNSDAVALGLIGALEVLWQGIAFQTEEDVDRAGARRRCMAYLASVFPGYFPTQAVASDWSNLPAEARHAVERERCFGQAWQLVGHVQEIPGPGDCLTIELAAARVLALRDAGRIRVFHNNCPHQPHVLVTGRRGRLAGHFACSLHQLNFGLDGRSIDRHSGASLAAVEFVVSAGFILAGTGALPPPDLAIGGTDASPLGPAITPLSGFAEHEIAADWKLAVEQLLLHRLADHESIGGVQRFSPPAVTVDPERRLVDWHATPAGGEYWSARRLATLLQARSDAVWERRFLWPNLLLEWRADGLGALQVIPVAAGRCRVQCFDYWLPAVDSATRALRFLAGRIARSALRLDMDLAVSTQRGLMVSGYVASGDAPVPRAVAAFRHMLAATLRSQEP